MAPPPQPRHTRLSPRPPPRGPTAQVLLSVRRYRAAASVSPAPHISLGEEEEEEDFFSYESLLNPPQHGAEAMAPVDEPCVAGLRDGFRSLSVSE